MAETPYLVDSNVLLRWVRPEHSDYPVTVSAMDALLPQDAILCYTSQNVAEFWNTCTRPVDRNGFGLSPQGADSHARSFEARLRLLPDSLAVHGEWRRLLVTWPLLLVKKIFAADRVEIREVCRPACHDLFRRDARLKLADGFCVAHQDKQFRWIKVFGIQLL